MSECVIRMEMPNSCYDCEIRDGKAYCPICGATLVGYKRSRHENCPILCQLPEGHGRLIDGSNLAEKHRELAYKNNNKYGFHITAKAWVEESITIVPAERNEL